MAPGPTPALSHHPLWNCFFPSLKICKCVKVGYSQPPCSLFSLLCCRIRGGGRGGGSRMHPSPGPWLAFRARRALRRLLASVLIQGQFRSPALEALPGCVTIAPHATLQSADSLVDVVGNGRQRGRSQGETNEIASVKCAGKMTEAWYLISEGYKSLITLPRCVIMMEDTVSLDLMDESAPLLDVLNSAIKQNNITSDLSILEGWIALCNVFFFFMAYKSTLISRITAKNVKKKLSLRVFILKDIK